MIKMRERLLLMSVLMLISICLKAGDDGKKTRNLSGKVIDANTSEALAGVQVTIPGSTVCVFTNLDGNFTIENLSPGSYDLVASFISYGELKLRNIKVSEESTSAIQMRLHQN